MEMQSFIRALDMIHKRLIALFGAGMLVSQGVYAKPENQVTICMPAIAICAVQVVAAQVNTKGCDKRGTGDPLEVKLSGPTGTGIEQPCKPVSPEPLQ